MGREVGQGGTARSSFASSREDVPTRLPHRTICWRTHTGCSSSWNPYVQLSSELKELTWREIIGEVLKENGSLDAISDLDSRIGRAQELGETWTSNLLRSPN
jgi:hypothetical protein